MFLISRGGDVLWDISLQQLMKLNCCVLSVSQERVPVRSTLLNMKKKAAHSKKKKKEEENVPSAITASCFFFHSVKAMQQLLYSASFKSFLSSCDQCVPITQSDIGGVWHARVVMDYEKKGHILIYIYCIYTVVLLAICDVLARTLLLSLCTV